MNFLVKKLSSIILSISFLFLIYIFYKSEIVLDGLNRDFYKIYYFISSVLIFFSIISFFLNYKIKEYLIISGISFLLSLYLFEGYLTFKKPVISTKSGLSPKYDNVLFLLSDEKIKTLTNKINQVLSLQPDRKKVLNEKITSFIKHNSWNNKAKNFVIWINKEIKFK